MQVSYAKDFYIPLRNKNEKEYIEKPEVQKLPKTQMKKIIKKEFSQYLNGFKKMLRKNRISRSPLYRESSLINFKEQLLIR